MACALAVLLGAGPAAAPARGVGQFQIQLNLGPGLAANPDAAAAFRRAADDWQSRISNPIRINIDADLATFGDPNIIGQTGYGMGNFNLDYTTVRDLMAARSLRPGDQILAYLPTTTQVSANVPPQGTFDRATIGILRANQKALGLIPDALNDTASDGNIAFNRAYTFDYDRSDGIDIGKIDFQTAATHEIGHVLGFVSDVDDFDFDPTLTDNATTLDLFRFNSGAKPKTFDEFRDFARELRPGQPSVTSDTVVEYPMSTGASNGDHHQASHWQDDFLFENGTITIGPTIGIMDPTLDYGRTEEITAADLRAMELIGYDTPEPGAAGMLVIAGAAMLARRRRA
jgi:hypothetical protein